MTTALVQSYQPKKKRTVFTLIHLPCSVKSRIVRIQIKRNMTTVKMAPKSFHQDDYDQPLTNIIYPFGTTDHRPYQTIARYRSAIEQSNNDFRHQPLTSNIQDTETLIIALDQLAQQFDGELIFTDRNISYDDDGLSQAAYGIANLSNVHLFTSNYVPTAVFTVDVDRQYERTLASSIETMQKFILDFVRSIARVLSCKEDFVRVFSLKKSKTQRKHTRITFGLTTTHQLLTERLAQNLQVHSFIHSFIHLQFIFLLDTY